MSLIGNAAEVSMADFQLALCHIVPSMYRGLEGMVENHPVDWEDIGGLHDVKQALKQVRVVFVFTPVLDQSIDSQGTQAQM